VEGDHVRPRIDYLSFQNNELVFVLAAEKLLDLPVPEKATGCGCASPS
jgi:NADH:ubiquinone oxidoreductase subunit D